MKQGSLAFDWLQRFVTDKSWPVNGKGPLIWPLLARPTSQSLVSASVQNAQRRMDGFLLQSSCNSRLPLMVRVRSSKDGKSPVRRGLPRSSSHRAAGYDAAKKRKGADGESLHCIDGRTGQKCTMEPVIFIARD